MFSITASGLRNPCLAPCTPRDPLEVLGERRRAPARPDVRVVNGDVTLDNSNNLIGLE